MFNDGIIMIAGNPISSLPISETGYSVGYMKINPNNLHYNGSIVLHISPLTQAFNRPTTNDIIDTTKNRFQDYYYGGGI